MPHFQIGSYVVGTVRYSGPIERFIYLTPEAGYSGPITNAYLYFRVSPPDFGYVTPSVVVPSLPLSDFDDFYHILQTEKPSYLRWGTDSANKITSCGVQTTAEPIGEGLKDFSP